MLFMVITVGLLLVIEGFKVQRFLIHFRHIVPTSFYWICLYPLLLYYFYCCYLMRKNYHQKCSTMQNNKMLYYVSVGLLNLKIEELQEFKGVLHENHDSCYRHLIRIIILYVLRLLVVGCERLIISLWYLDRY